MSIACLTFAQHAALLAVYRHPLFCLTPKPPPKKLLGLRRERGNAKGHVLDSLPCFKEMSDTLSFVRTCYCSQ
jgi:hypothetical protein